MTVALGCWALVLMGFAAVARDAWRSRRFRVLPLTPPVRVPAPPVPAYFEQEYDAGSLARRYPGAIVLSGFYRPGGRDAPETAVKLVEPGPLRREFWRTFPTAHEAYDRACAQLEEWAAER